MSDLLRDWCGLCSRVYLQRFIGPECQPALLYWLTGEVCLGGCVERPRTCPAGILDVKLFAKERDLGNKR